MYCHKIRSRISKIFIEGTKNLHQLSITNCEVVTDKLLQKIGQNCIYLIQLRLPNCMNITDKGIEYVMACQNIRILYLHGTSITSEVSTLLVALKDLEYVSLNFTTEAVLKNLIDACPLLISVSTKNETRFNTKFVMKYKKKRQNLQILNYGFAPKKDVLSP